MNVDMNSAPIACDMNVFTSVEREAHIQNTRQLYDTVQAIHEISNGYEFLFPCNTETVAKLAEFIVNDDQPISLTLSGPEGTREFLREEFSEAFA